MNLVLLGPPGAGKGTQAVRLSEAFGYRHLSSGDVLRAERTRGTELGGRVARFMDAGNLVPDEMVVEVVLARLTNTLETYGFLLDGFPRTLTQAQSLDEALQVTGHGLDLVPSLQVPDGDIVGRITGRRTCTGCGAVFHVRYHRPSKEGFCDACGSALAQRPDDTADVVGQRLAAYHEQTEPLGTYYRQRGILAEVDGTPGVDEVFEQLSGVVRQRMETLGL
jgi:adenylate kinase